ncbi:hypothetical protein KP509_36G063500 [Ceratopteris richardii]|nr:hypothetical protein KP509_36G063500 [Ceratopteris richardii]
MLALCVCNSQLNISTECKRIHSSLSFDYSFNTTFKTKGIHLNHALQMKRKSFFSVVNALKETTEKVTVGERSLEAGGAESLIRNELSALDAYFNKLQGKEAVQSGNEASSESKEEVAVPLAESISKATGGNLEPTVEEDQSKNDAAKTNLKSIEMYLEQLSKGSSSYLDMKKDENELETLLKEVSPSTQLLPSQELEEVESSLAYMDEAANLDGSESSVVYIVAAINIAVYIFGLASPIETAGMGTSTLPLLYGAKVNELLLNGEWWRLVTPMFLHSGFFHIALSSWALLFFGPQVERVFGPLAFCMIYFLGGLCGNICSFYFTSAATVGGTGPLFALFSAWVAYLWLNREALGEKSAEFGIKATTLMGILVLGLSCLLPTDEWIHVGAILPGFLFGSFAAPSLQVGADGSDPGTSNEQYEGQQYGVFDSPSVLSLTTAFVLSTGLCFTIYNILATTLENTNLLDEMPL